MPFISESSYKKAPYWQINGHFQTIAPSVFRKVTGVQYTRERIETADTDFLDLDWLHNDSQNLVLLTHGLEGSSIRPYMMSMAKHFSEAAWDVLAWNCRSCSGEMNRLFRMYHHGEIGDIAEVIAHALKQKSYKNIVLIGFSMGGNITLKYLSVNAGKLPEPIRGGVAFSAPTHLESCSIALDNFENLFYRRKFFRNLSAKIRFKSEAFPGIMNPEKLADVKVWRDFDEWFSAKLGNFKDADDFYQQCSAINFMFDVKVPMLLVNAVNDPILTPLCSPIERAKTHAYLHLECPRLGGHVGFAKAHNAHLSWMDERALEWANGIII